MRKSRWLLIVALCIVGGLTFLVAQDPGVRQPYVWFKDNGGNHFVPLSGAITVALDGKSATINSGNRYTFGAGLATVDPGGGQPIQVSVDTAFILFRGTPTAPQPGPCTVATGAIIYGSDSFRYECSPDGTGGFRWARSPMETSW